MQLKQESSQEWLNYVLSHFDRFLIDHAACERKASAMAMSMVAHYPDKYVLVKAMIDLALEEMQHFKQVYEWLEKRKLVLGSDEKDPYVNQLLKLCRNGSHEYFLDRLILAGVIEARGCERFFKISQKIEDEELKKFYKEIATCEAKHQGLFIELAKEYFSESEIKTRLDEILIEEAKIIAQIPIRAAVH